MNKIALKCCSTKLKNKDNKSEVMAGVLMQRTEIGRKWLAIKEK